MNEPYYKAIIEHNEAVWRAEILLEKLCSFLEEAGIIVEENKQYNTNSAMGKTYYDLNAWG